MERENNDELFSDKVECRFFKIHADRIDAAGEVSQQ